MKSLQLAAIAMALSAQSASHSLSPDYKFQGVLKPPKPTRNTGAAAARRAKKRRNKRR